MKKLRRTRFLIKPLLQMKLVLVFLSAATVTCIVQAILLVYTLSDLATRLPNDGEMLRGELSGIVMTNLTLGMVLLAVLTIAVGVLATFRFAGPLHRFEGFLRDVADGRESGPCTLREGDELRHLCDLLNEVTAPLRAALREEPEGGGEEDPQGDLIDELMRGPRAFWGELEDVPSLVDRSPEKAADAAPGVEVELPPDPGPPL